MKKENYAERVSVLCEIDRYMESTHSEAIPTGFRTVDSVLGGIKSPGLVLLGTRPSVGKTALARTMAKYLAVDKGIPVAYFSLEQSAIQLTRLFLRSDPGIVSAIKAVQESEELKESIYKLKEAPLFIDDTAWIDMESLRGRVRTLVENNGVRVIFIDFIQLLYWRRYMKWEDIDSRKEMKRTLTELKQTAEDLGIAIVALTQLPHTIERMEKEISLEDLMKRLDIDQDIINDHVDMIWLLYRPDYYGLSDGRERAELNVVHNIHGRRNLTFDLRFIPEYVDFEEPE